MRFSESLKKIRISSWPIKRKVLCEQIPGHVCQEEWNFQQQTGSFGQQKVGNSVVRHRVTRLLRESYRLQEDYFRRGYDLIIIARAGAKDKSYHEIESAMIHLGKLHHIYTQDTQQDSSDNEMEMKRWKSWWLQGFVLQKHLSKYKLPTQHCIYTPTCSEYGLEAIEKYGALKGGLFNNLENTQM